MSEASSVEQQNRLWSLCKREKRPYVVLKKGTTKCTLDYDMWTINYDLKPSAVKAIRSLFDKILGASTTLKSCWVTAGKSTGFIGKMPLDVGRKFLPELAAIVENKENWVGITMEDI